MKPGVRPAVPAAAAKQIKSEFALVLWLGDQAAARTLPTYWETPEDRLTEDERTTLVNAVYNELEARFPAALKFLAKVGDSAPEAALLYAIAMVAAPRLARHGIIPQELASAIVFAPLLFASVQQQQSAEPGAAASVATEPARVDYRPDGTGEVDASGAPSPGSPLQVGAPLEAGFSDVRHGPSSQNGQSDH